MKHTGILGLILIAALPLQAAEAIRLNSKPGTLKVRVEGTSNVHDWRVVGKLIGGYMEVGSDFPLQPGQAAKPGNYDVKVEAFIPVRSLASIEKDGTPYSTAMDDIMYEKLKASEHQRIYYRLNELVLKEAPKSKELPYVFDSKGELVVAGVTNQISTPVSITPLGDNQLKITGTVDTKMTSFKIDPPAPKIALGLIKTADEIKLIFEWLVVQKKPAAN